MKLSTSANLVLILASVLFFASCSKKTPEVKPQQTPLAITSLSVSSGQYNTSVLIIGTGFDALQANDKVFFNGKAASITAATTTQLTATVPVGAGTGNVTVSVNNGAPAFGPVFTYEKAYFVTTLAGSAATGIENGSGANAIFNQPTGICSDAAGNLYITEALNHLIRKITPDGVVSSFAGTATDAANNGTLTTHYLTFPQAATFSSSGDFYVADALTNIIEKISPGGTVSTVAGTLNAVGLVDGPALSASFNGPHGMCFDPSGNLYIADTFNNCIRKVDPNGNVTTFAGNRQPGHVNGMGTSALLNGPSGIVSDAAGNLYVSDSNNGRIRKITPAGMVSDWGAPVFSYPDGIAIDLSGNLYVADSTGVLIKKIDQSGTVTTIAGNIYIHSQTDGVGTAAGFYTPVGIAIDNSGNLYVTDGNEVRKITLE